MEAICSSETSVDTQRTTRLYIQEDGTLQGLSLFNINSQCAVWCTDRRASQLKERLCVLMRPHGTALYCTAQHCSHLSRRLHRSVLNRLHSSDFFPAPFNYNPHSYIPFVEIHFNIILLSKPDVPSSLVPFLLSLPCILHNVPISYSSI
jgi:hypothetical protein